MQFTEEMNGWFTPGCPAYNAGFHTGRRDNRRLMFHLTIDTPDVRHVLSDPEHPMRAHGWVASKDLGPARMTVENGTFNLFTRESSSRQLLMRYDLPFQGTEGPMTLQGVKHIGNNPGFDLWTDTTTLFARVLHADGREYGRGIMHLNAMMFARQLTTFRGRPIDLARFGTFFSRSLAQVYLRRPLPLKPVLSITPTPALTLPPMPTPQAQGTGS